VPVNPSPDLSTDLDALVTQLVNEVFVLNGRLLAEGDGLAATVGLTAAQWLVLGGLADEPMTVAALARRRGLRRQSVQETANRLLRDGMVTRTANPGDRRAPVLHLTDTARAALGRLESSRERWARELGSVTPAADLRATLATLRRIREDLDRQTSVPRPDAR
jgi:DNA-binding MarR family transcriptional regulator